MFEDRRYRQAAFSFRGMAQTPPPCTDGTAWVDLSGRARRAPCPLARERGGYGQDGIPVLAG